MALENIVALAGGVGGAKLAFGLSRVLKPEQFAVVVNTGDDFTHYGLAISPDLDTVMYTLAEVANPQTGWGLAGDTDQMLQMLACYGEKPWFGLRDRDLATHLLRTQALAAGQTLTEITRRLCTALGIRCRVLPMTDAPVRTVAHTKEYGTLEFQEYFVRYRWQPTVEALDYLGAEAARLSPPVEAAIIAADLVIVCPSNPWLSIGPILAVPGMRDLLRGKPCVAVSPIVAGTAVKGPAAKLMSELGWEVSAAAVADFYGDLLAGFVLDQQDEILLSEGRFSCPVFVTNTMMLNDDDKIRLAHEMLTWAGEWLP